MKSLKLKQLTPLLKNSNFRFVSLQYGDDGPHLERYRKDSGVEVLHDDTTDLIRHGRLAESSRCDGCSDKYCQHNVHVPVA